jgi:general nucleoside transport system permease protein
MSVFASIGMHTATLLAALDFDSINLPKLLGQALRLGVLVAFVALGETFSQRAGVINVGVEGVFLSTCCVAAVVSFLGWGLLAGFVGAAVGGVIVMAIVAFVVLRLRADQIVTGFGINLIALGVTTVVVKAKPDLNSVEGLSILRPFGREGALADVFSQKWSVFLVVPVTVVCMFVLNRTAWGLRVKAVGETPAAADAAGIGVDRVRLQAMLVCGALIGLGGAAFSLGQAPGFTENMVSGRGFIALVAVIFGRWRPVQVVLSCLFFGIFEAVSLQAPGWGIEVPSQLLNAVPYVACLAALSLFRKGATPPAAMARPFERKR